jgi:type VI secretion system protein ImpM
MSIWQPTAVGFHGKIPSRGDFVRAGLKRDFVSAWDDWLQHGIAASRAALGEDWQPAWLEAPIWHFALSAGLCGADAAVGLFLPSVDRAGRHFPLAIVALVADASPRSLAAAAAGFLAAAEQAGLAALETDLAPEALAAAVATAAQQPGGEMPAALAELPDSGSLWWTAGSPRVPAGARHDPAMPQAGSFAAMLIQTTLCQTGAMAESRA